MTGKRLIFSSDHYYSPSDSNVLNAICNNKYTLRESEMIQYRETEYKDETQNVKESLISLEDGEKNDPSMGFTSLTSNLGENQEMISNAKRDRKYHCAECEYSTYHRRYFCDHMRTHTGERPFKCHQCNKAFSLKGKLIRHQQVHSGEKAFQCNHCHKAFIWKDNLIQHLKIHSGEKPFQCDHCHKAFRREYHLKAHLRIHSGELPFLCSFCGMGFNQNGNMIRHRRTHIIKLPFQDSQRDTDDCQDPFKIEVLRNVSSSIIGHNEEVSFMCNTNGGQFHTWNNVRTYQAEIHPSTNTFLPVPSLQKNMDQTSNLEHLMCNIILT